MKQGRAVQVRRRQWQLLFGGAVAVVLSFTMAACEDPTVTVPDFELPPSDPFEAGTSTPATGIDAAPDTTPETDASPDADPETDAGADAAAAVCNDGKIDPGETCDPLASCPTTCPAIECQLRALENGGTCRAKCIDVAVQTACVNGDGCCPPTCNTSNDDDCKVTCDNGLVETGETCDPLASCPTSCAPIGCQLRNLENAGTCKAECVNAGKITECKDGDGCCPDGCNANNDAECGVGCGNNVIEPGETCDPLESCPTSCPPIQCQLRRLENAGTCQAQCVDDVKQTLCINNDGCCPDECNANNDNDCKPKCGNGVIEAGEVCDPVGSCPTTCEQEGCTLYKLENPSTCQAQCVKAGAQDQCIDNDGCCPDHCNAANDNNCTAECGNAVLEPGETCDPKIPGSCPVCEKPVYTCQKTIGSASTCDLQCNAPVKQCQGPKALPDNCCPFNENGGCGSSDDPDCLGDRWQFVKIADFDSRELSGRLPCTGYTLEGIVPGASYAITTCSPTGGATGDTEIRLVRSLDAQGVVVEYPLAVNDDCTDPTALPRLAGWDCRSSTINVPSAMSCGTPSPGGFKAVKGAAHFQISVCAAAKGASEPPAQALGVAPVYIWYNAPSAPRLVPPKK